MTILEGSRVRLAPLEFAHEAGLIEAAADGELWDLKVTTVPRPDAMRGYIETAHRLQDAGLALPFATIHRASGRVVGSTRYLKIDRPNRKLEIGSTWLSRSAQRTAINTEAKLLMLSHAFETLGCVRVQFTTDALNEASRAAILRLGAVQEGILRNERIMPDGRLRHSVRFSILDSEWPSVRDRLNQMLERVA
jgi:RimJ/RimL family protein N-acetyltransferase